VVEGWGRTATDQIGCRTGSARVAALYAPVPSNWVAATAARYGVPMYRDLDMMIAEWGPEPLSDWSDIDRISTGTPGVP
jgi:hypothetical protein